MNAEPAPPKVNGIFYWLATAVIGATFAGQVVAAKSLPLKSIQVNSLKKLSMKACLSCAPMPMSLQSKALRVIAIFLWWSNCSETPK